MNDIIESNTTEAVEEPDRPFTIVSRDESMKVLRRGGVPDSLLAAAFGLSRQRIHFRLGPRPLKKRKNANVTELEEALNDLPTFMREWRERNQLSMAQAARRSGVSTVSWFSWESGRTICSVEGLLIRYLLLAEQKNKP